MALQFPHEAPAAGDLKQICEGIYWLRMPLPLALDHINLYLLEEDAGWYIVDTGINMPGTQEVWQAVFAGLLADKPLLGVICTHMHPDHCGMAGWLCDEHRVPLWMSQGEYFAARIFANFKSGPLAWQSLEFQQHNGQSQAYIEHIEKRMGGFAKMVYPMPKSYRRLQDGDVLNIGGRDWRVMTGAGHSVEHVCLFNEAERLLLAGDQIIARISPNVSVQATEPEGNPLADWLNTQERLKQLPADTLIMPAHNKPFVGVVERAQDLIDHHEDHMVALLQACVEPKPVMELMPVLFKREIGFDQMGMALGECLAHLHLLMQRKLMTRGVAEDGRYLYKTVDAEAIPALRCPGNDNTDELLMV